MTVKMVSSSLPILGLCLAVALVGCSGDDTSTSGDSASGSDTDTGSTTDTTTSTTQTSASGTTTTDSGTGTSDSSTGTTAPETTGETSGSTTGDPTTGTTGDPTTTTGDPTTGTTGGGDGNGCAEICDTITGCFQMIPLDECMANCEDDFGMADGAECQAATAEVNMCLAGLECQNFIDDNFADCGDAFAAQEMACGGGMQDCVAEKAQMGPNCTFAFDCGQDQLAVQCNSNQGVCTCIENGQDGDTCDNMDYCAADPDEAFTIANECCGWQL